MQEKYVVCQRKYRLTIKMGGLFKNLRCLQKLIFIRYVYSHIIMT